MQQPITVPMPDTLVDLDHQLAKATADLAELHWIGATRWAIADQRSVVESIRIRRDAARNVWRLECLEQRFSNPGTDGPND